MKIMVFAHRLDVGGTQVNAIELTQYLRDTCGHDVVVFATPGPMNPFLEQKGLRYIPAPDASVHPSMPRMRALQQAIAEEQPDLLYVWDWPQCLDAFYSVYATKRVPMVVTSMSMVVNRMLPKDVPTTFGTPELVDRAKANGRQKLGLILPPVDVASNSMSAVDGKAFRRQHGFADDDIVTVSRLVAWMKAESLRDTIEAVRRLGRDYPLRFAIVGDGTSRPELEEMAKSVNEELGRQAIILTGALIDPRPAYAAADIVVGMGGSALRGLAFEKAVIVVGEQGFSRPFNQETADYFYYMGIYGLGDGKPGADALTGQILQLVESRKQFPALGAFGRQFILDNFSLEVVGAALNTFLIDAARSKPTLGDIISDGARTAAVLVGERLLPHSIRRAFVR